MKTRILMFFLMAFVLVSFSKKEKRTIVTITGDQFYINGEITYKGRYWQGHKIEGLLLNSRMVQGIFDDLNPKNHDRFAYPDTKIWDADRNTNEFSYLVGMAKLIQKQDDVGLKGHRSVESSKYPRLLKSFNFNALHPFDQVFAHQYEVLFSDDKKTVTLKLMGFRSFSRINWSSRYEVYRITMVIAQQPDWIWDERNGLFKPTVDKLEMLSVTTFSDWHSRSTEPEDIILTASFAQPALQEPGMMVVVALGLEVSAYQLDSSMSNATGVGTMKIVECFV